MSTDPAAAGRGRAARRIAQGRRVFTSRLVAVLGALVLVAGITAAITLVQGPRVTKIDVDPAASTLASGSRFIVTTNQALQELTAENVTVTPEADFTVDTSGRTVGLRFSQPLWDDTEYTVRITGLQSVSGGPPTEVEETFHTPALSPLLMQRSGNSSDDRIVRTGLAGDASTTIFRAPEIEDFRATATDLVVATRTGDTSRLLAMTPAGKNVRDMRLPDEGTVTDLQSADRGSVVGYVFTGADVGSSGSLENALFVTNVTTPDADPRQITRPGGDSRVVDWRFVPGTDSIVMLTFDGALTLVTADGDDVPLGNAISIEGIARGSTVLVVNRIEGAVAIDLATAEEAAVVPGENVDGDLQTITPLTDGHLELRSVVDGFTVLATLGYRVAADGDAEEIFDSAPGDIVLQTCVAPSGRYAAYLVAPDAVNNPYDGYLLPLPERTHTRVVDLTTGESVADLEGSSISWCQKAPPL